MMKRLVLTLALLLIVPTMSRAGAVTVIAVTTALGGGNYHFDYSLTNDGAAGGLNELWMFFNSDDAPGADFAPLAISEPLGWTHADPGAVIPPEIGHQAWSIDWVLTNPLDPGVLEGESLSGFGVDFHWSGQGEPGPQFFEAFAYTPHEGTTVTPEPASMGLVAVGLGLLALVGVRSARRGGKA